MDLLRQAEEISVDSYNQFVEEFNPEKVLDSEQTQHSAISRQAGELVEELQILSSRLSSESPDLADPVKVEPFQKKINKLQ